jgi:RNA polymerase sigma-70 factor (ECF subfamily)
VSSVLSSTDTSVVARVRAGDVAAFESLFKTYHAKLLPFAASYVDSAAIGDEIVADVFAWVWEHRETWSPGVSIAAYLYGAVRNRALNEAKRSAADRRRVVELAADGELPGVGARGKNPAQQIEEDDMIAAVWRAVEALPERRRLILTLRWRYELAWDEIAAVVGTTSAAVQMDHSRALQALRSVLGEE